MTNKNRPLKKAGQLIGIKTYFLIKPNVTLKSRPSCPITPIPLARPQLSIQTISGSMSLLATTHWPQMRSPTCKIKRKVEFPSSTLPTAAAAAAGSVPWAGMPATPQFSQQGTDDPQNSVLPSHTMKSSNQEPFQGLKTTFFFFYFN